MTIDNLQCEHLRPGGICSISRTITGKKGRRIADLKFDCDGKCYKKMSLKCNAFLPESTR
jgi:hypothetical protein